MQQVCLSVCQNKACLERRLSRKLNQKSDEKQAGEIISSIIQSAMTQIPATKPTPLKQRRVVKRKRQGRQHPYKKKARQRDIFDV